MKPRKISRLDLAFGPSKLSEFLPPMAAIPEDFQRDRSPWCDFVQTWFFKGADAKRLKAKPGIDQQTAIAHCAAIMRSFEPKHEHKIAGVAFLLSQWFEPLPAEHSSGAADGGDRA